VGLFARVAHAGPSKSVSRLAAVSAAVYEVTIVVASASVSA
jgi:hypothetical protein